MSHFEICVVHQQGCKTRRANEKKKNTVFFFLLLLHSVCTCDVNLYFVKEMNLMSSVTLIFADGDDTVNKTLSFV